MKRRNLLFAVALLSAIFAVPADADPALDFNPPTWRGEAYSTTQQWTFPTEDYQPYADAWDNPFGQMQIDVLEAGTIQYYESSNSSMKWESLQYLGAGDESQQMMRIETWPNWPDSATNKEAWVQVTWGVHFYGIDAPYDRASMLYLSAIGIDGIYPTPATDAQILGIETDSFGNTTEWYHTTFQIPFGNAPWDDIIVYPYAGGVLTPEPIANYDIYISEVVVDTICVPEPTAIALLALGALALRRRK